MQISVPLSIWTSTEQPDFRVARRDVETFVQGLLPNKAKHGTKCFQKKLQILFSEVCLAEAKFPSLCNHRLGNMTSLLRQVSSKVSKTMSVLAKCGAVGTRRAHTHRDLPYPIEGGLGRFLPPKALETLAEYQDGLLARLDDELRSTSD